MIKGNKRKTGELACELVDVLDVAEIGVWELNLKTNEVTVDKSYCKLVGCKEKTKPVAMEDMKQLFFSEDWKDMEKSLSDYLQGRREVHKVEHRLKRKDGSIIWVLARGRVTNCGGDSADRVLGSIMDITERKMAEEALRRSEERYRGIFENSADPIINIDTKGFVTEVNSAIEETFGYYAEEVIGKNAAKFSFLSTKTKAIVAAKIAEFLIKGEVDPYEVEMKTKGGDKRIVKIKSSKIVEDAKMVGIQSIIRDITERRAAEEVLKKRNSELERFYEMSLPDYSKKKDK